MRRHLYFTAIALTLGVSAGAFAQGGGSSFGGGSGGGAGGGSSSFGGGSGGGSSIGGGGSGLGGGGSSFGGSSSGGSSGFGGGSSGGTSISGSTGGFGGGSGAGGGGAGGGRGTGGGTSGFTVSPTNQFGTTYSNPLAYSKGMKITTMTNAAQVMQGVGFGQPSLGAVTAARTTATGTTGRAGSASVNRGGMSGGLGGGQNMPAISYATTMRFPTTPIVPQALRVNLQNVVFRSSAISVPGNVRVENDGTTIVLRGKVVDEDEKRLVEGMVRLEPGVQDVRNELQVGP